jgi:hypothetical protein
MVSYGIMVETCQYTFVKHRMNKIKMEVQGNYRWGENDMSMEVCD